MDVPISDRITLPGSERAAPQGERIGDVPGDERVTVTIVVRAAHPDAGVEARESAMSASLAERTYVSRETFAQTHGASDADLEAVAEYAGAGGLDVGARDLSRRTIVVEGKLAALGAAFGTRLARYRSADGTEFRGRIGPLTIPRALSGIIEGIFGLDDRPQARAQFRRAVVPAAGAAPISYSPLQISAAYAFPPGDGAGQTIALVELGGGYTQADLDAYFGGLGVPSPVVASVSVDGGTNAPAGTAQSADSEVLLDIEVAGAIAPGAKLVVYFAPNTDRGFLDAVSTAIHDTENRPQILSISWGGPETTWTAQALAAFDAVCADAAMLGITVLCAAGDNGSGDNVGDGTAHVDFPASSPHVVACGGTRLEIDATGSPIERVWNDAPTGGATGGGISDAFDVPAWQTSANVPPSVNANARVGRGVPDIAGDADPQTGYAVLVDGASSVIGGTSAVAPLWAALVARLNAGLTQPLGFLNPLLYAHPDVLRDIVVGDNGAYRAGVGWDACTGLGSPDGAKIAALVRGS